MPLRRVILVRPRGFCAGVERAVSMVDQALARHGRPLYCYRELVHNRYVVDGLARRGVAFVDRLEDVPEGAAVVFSAHGVAPAVYAAAAARRLVVIDATCPFVAKVHAEVRRFVKQGCTVLLIGHRGHDEVRGIVGEAPESIRVIENRAEAEAIEVPDAAAVATVTQTTLSVTETAAVVAGLRRRFPSLRTPAGSDICYATQNRQEAVIALARQADMVLVLGAVNSSNTNRLVEVARAAGGRAELISRPEELASLDLREAETVGVTAGASTPESLVQNLVEALRRLGATEVAEMSLGREEVHFETPSETSEG